MPFIRAATCCCAPPGPCVKECYYDGSAAECCGNVRPAWGGTSDNPVQFDAVWYTFGMYATQNPQGPFSRTHEVCPPQTSDQTYTGEYCYSAGQGPTGGYGTGYYRGVPDLDTYLTVHESMAAVQGYMGDWQVGDLSGMYDEREDFINKYQTGGYDGGSVAQMVTQAGKCPGTLPPDSECEDLCGGLDIYMPQNAGSHPAYAAAFTITINESCTVGACATVRMRYYYVPRPNNQGGRNPLFANDMVIRVAGCPNCDPPSNPDDPCITELYCPTGTSHGGDNDAAYARPVGVYGGCSYSDQALCEALSVCDCIFVPTWRDYEFLSADDPSLPNFNPACVYIRPELGTTAAGYLGPG